MEENNHPNRLGGATANGLHLHGTSTASSHAVTNGSFPSHGATHPPLSANRTDDLTLKDIVAMVSQALLIIRAKWYWGVLAAVIVGGALGTVLLRRPYEHSAQTLMLAQGTLDKVIGSRAEDQGDLQSRENNLRNHLSVMNSRKFRARVIASFSEDEKNSILTPYLEPGEKVTDTGVESLLTSKINVERERGREFFTIQVKHLDGEIALTTADRLAAQYLAFVQSEFREANKSGFDLLQKQADTLRKELADIEEERLDFRKRHKIISRSDNQGILSDRLRRLDGNLTEIRVRHVQLERQLAQVQQDRKKSEYPWDNAYLATYANNPLLRQELDRNLAQRSVLASRYGPNHPKLRDMDASITGVRDNILRNFDLAVLDLQTQFDVTQRTEQQFQAEFDEAFSSSIEIEKLASRYEIIGTDVDAKRETLAQLQKKIGDAGLSSQLPADFMQIVDPAFLVKEKLPRKLIHLGFVIIVAIGAFTITPLLVNLLDERVKGTSDLEVVLGKSLLGAVPVLKYREQDRAHVVRDRTDLGCSEAFIGISAQLDLISVHGYPKVVLVTSTLPSEGKSTVASNLAAAYTQLKKKTVILDLDLRRPTQHRLHGTDTKTGYLAWARAGFPMNELLKPEGILGLKTLPDGTHLITAGGDEPQPSHFLISKSLTLLIQELKNCFDVVVLDTPPAGVFQDALVLARTAHERILVTRESKAPVSQVQKVISDFDKAGSPFTGTILNGFNPAAAHKKLAYGYSKSNYGYTARKPEKKKKIVANQPS